MKDEFVVYADPKCPKIPPGSWVCDYCTRQKVKKGTMHVDCFLKNECAGGLYVKVTAKGKSRDRRLLEALLRATVAPSKDGTHVVMYPPVVRRKWLTPAQERALAKIRSKMKG